MMSTVRNFDVIVIGAGVEGSATAYQLTKLTREKRIALVEQVGLDLIWCGCILADLVYTVECIDILTVIYANACHIKMCPHLMPIQCASVRWGLESRSEQYHVHTCYSNFTGITISSIALARDWSSSKKHGVPIQDRLVGLLLFSRIQDDFLSLHRADAHIYLLLKNIKAFVPSTVHSVPAIASTVESADRTMTTFVRCSFVIQSTPLVRMQLLFRLPVVAYHVLIFVVTC